MRNPHYWEKSFNVINQNDTRPGNLLQFAIENGPVEIVDLPIKHDDFP